MTYIFNIKMTTYLIDLGQPELTCEILNLGYETIITLQKANKKNYEA